MPQPLSHSDVKLNSAQVEAFFRPSADPLCIADFNYRFCTVNDAWSMALGYRIEELAGRSYLDFVHPDDIDGTLQCAETLARGETIRFVNRYRATDGSYRWLEWTSQPDIIAGLIYAVARDVTEQKQKEQEISAREKTLAIAQSISGLGSWERNLLTGQMTWSMQTHLIFGT